MVTHNWGNSFSNLLAAVLSDALQECSFSLPAELLQEECTFLQDLLAKWAGWTTRIGSVRLLNQHISICHSNPYDRDPFTDQLHPVCHCNSTNIVDPDGRSASSEINKFDDMMSFLATTGGCRQVIAVDKSLDLFRRAWCVAEIAEAKTFADGPVIETLVQSNASRTRPDIGKPGCAGHACLLGNGQGTHPWQDPRRR